MAVGGSRRDESLVDVDDAHRGERIDLRRNRRHRRREDRRHNEAHHAGRQVAGDEAEENVVGVVDSGGRLFPHALQLVVRLPEGQGIAAFEELARAGSPLFKSPVITFGQLRIIRPLLHLHPLLLMKEDRRLLENKKNKHDRSHQEDGELHRNLGHGVEQ